MRVCVFSSLAEVNGLLSKNDFMDDDLAELFLAEQKFRRDLVALKLQKLAIRDARSRVSEDYSSLAEIKGLLSKNGFVDTIERHVQCRELMGAPDQPGPPIDLAYSYEPQGTSCGYPAIWC
jgi:hypothetical protein